MTEDSTRKPKSSATVNWEGKSANRKEMQEGNERAKEKNDDGADEER